MIASFCFSALVLASSTVLHMVAAALSNVVSVVLVNSMHAAFIVDVATAVAARSMTSCMASTDLPAAPD